MWMIPEPFPMFGFMCLWLVRVYDSGDRRGCSFLNTMSETWHQETVCALCSPLLQDRADLFFNEEYLHLEFFFMCHIVWTNQPHVTLAQNEVLTNVDVPI